VGLAVTEVARRRTDQFGYFMGVLEFSAIDLDARTITAKEGFGHGFDHAGLAAARGTEEEKVTDWTTRSIQARQEHLVNLGDFLDGGILSDDTLPHSFLKITRIVRAFARVQLKSNASTFHAYSCSESEAH
jgi:hypothetical protein